MEYLIKINRDSIKKNSDVNGGMRSIPGRWIPDGKGGGSRTVTPEYSMAGGPEWLFDYLPCYVSCEFCSRYFPYEDLKHEDTYDYECACFDGADYKCIDRNNICPYCDTEDCCEIRHETLEEAQLDQNERDKITEEFLNGTVDEVIQECKKEDTVYKTPITLYKETYSLLEKIQKESTKWEKENDKLREETGVSRRVRKFIKEMGCRLLDRLWKN